MERGRASYPMRSRLPGVIAGLILFAGCSLFGFAMRGTVFPGSVGLLLGVLGAGLTVLMSVGVVNLLGHEGWEVVLSDDALELPAAPYRSRRRDRIPYATIEFVGLAPGPPDRPEMVVIHVSPGTQIRWVRQADLETSTVTEIARQLAGRVSALRGDGRVVRVTYPS